MEFEKMISDAVIKKLNDGTVELLINKKLEEAIEKTLGDCLGWNGEAYKLLKGKLEEVMVPCIEQHNFNEYLVKLDSCLTEIVNNTNLKDNRKILENFAGLMKEPETETVKLSEIFEKYCKHVAKNVSTNNLEACHEDGEPYYSSVTATMEVEHEDKRWFNSRYDDCYIKLTCEEDKDLNCQLKLFKSQTEDHWRILNGVSSIEINSLRRLSDFDVFLSVLDRGFIKIEMDTESEYDDEVEPEEKPEWSLA